MEIDNVFFMALQSSLMLGLIHGINPCGHSWLVLAPFVSGEKDGRRVSMLTLSFILGTAVACLFIGWSLGAVSSVMGSSVRFWADIAANSIIITLGAILLIKPDMLHRHDHSGGHCLADGIHAHEPHHDHASDPGHDHHHYEQDLVSRFSKITGAGLFSIGFVNMIIPCPTAALMYSYAIESGSALRSTMVFGIYALSTGIAVAAVIYAIYRVTTLVRQLNKHWLESAVLRGVGVLTIVFGTYSLLADTIL